MTATVDTRGTASFIEAHLPKGGTRRYRIVPVKDFLKHKLGVETTRVGTRIEMLARAYSDDVIGMKRSVERLETVAAKYPGWSA